MHSARAVARVTVFTAFKLRVAWALIFRPIVHDGTHGGFCFLSIPDMLFSRMPIPL